MAWNSCSRMHLLRFRSEPSPACERILYIYKHIHFTFIRNCHTVYFGKTRKIVVRHYHCVLHNTYTQKMYQVWNIRSGKSTNKKHKKKIEHATLCLCLPNNNNHLLPISLLQPLLHLLHLILPIRPQAEPRPQQRTIHKRNRETYPQPMQLIVQVESQVNSNGDADNIVGA